MKLVLLYFQSLSPAPISKRSNAVETKAAMLTGSKRRPLGLEYEAETSDSFLSAEVRTNIMVIENVLKSYIVEL